VELPEKSRARGGVESAGGEQEGEKRKNAGGLGF